MSRGWGQPFTCLSRTRTRNRQFTSCVHQVHSTSGHQLLFRQTPTTSTSTSTPTPSRIWKCSTSTTSTTATISFSSSPSKILPSFLPPASPVFLPPNVLIDSNVVPLQLPDYIVQRNQLFEELKSQHVTALALKTRNLINVILDTTVDDAAKSVLEVPATTWETTPGQLLRHVSKEIAGEAVVAKVNGTLWDLSRPLEEDGHCKISYLSIKDPEGRAVFWHSAAHLLGEAAEHEYGCMLSHGPPTATGFFYDMALEPGRAVKESDWPALEANAKKFSKEKQPFERLEVSKEDLRKLFGYSKYKMHFVEMFVPDGGSSTVYRNGALVDLCLGPHIQNTKQISAFKIMNNGSAYFLGDQANDSLQRVYGVAFPKAEQMKEWELFLKKAKARDHQEIGKQQKLFWFSQLSPGSPFLLPHGTRIFNAIQTMLREQYWERGYDEVHSPLMYDVELWKTSGHWKHYQDDMFRVPFKISNPVAASSTSENATTTIDATAPAENKDKGLFALKPMNCPGHCLMFASEERSYRTLPWRVADFSVLHRNEASGALSGLTRVRKFQQDDGHIFCTVDQVTRELEGMFDFMTYVYSLDSPSNSNFPLILIHTWGSWRIGIGRRSNSSKRCRLSEETIGC